MVTLIFPSSYHRFIITFIFLVVLRTHGSIVANELTTKVATPSHIVLVHGASLGGWCWYKVRTLLESAGYNVTSPDLKGAGIDPTNANTLVNFKEYNQPLLDILSSVPEGEKVILVGHSFGGFSITDAIIRFPEKIQVAVYVAAAMVNDAFPPGQGGPPISDLNCFWEEEGSPFPTSCIFKKEIVRDKFYNKSPLEESTLASMLFKPFPFRSFLDFPIPGELKDVPRIFIKTTNDNLFDPSNQELMTILWPPSQIFTIEGSDHMAMISQPFKLFDILVEIANNNYDLSSNNNV